MAKKPYIYYGNLKDTALEKQGSETKVWDATTSTWVGRPMTEEEKAQAAIDYFLKAGLDYKGQFQCCYETKGGGLQVDVSVDPGRIFCPVLSTEITAGISVTKSQGLFLVAQRGPSLPVNSAHYCYTTPFPLMLNCFSGSSWEGAANAGIEVSIGIKYSASAGALNSEDPLNKTESKVEKSWVEKEEPDPAFEMENFGVGFEAEAKAGVRAEVGYTYQHYYAEDLCPVTFKVDDGAGITQVKKQLLEIFDAGSYKYLQKQKVCKWINAHPGLFKPVKYHDPHWYKAGKGFITSKEICKILTKGCTKSGIDKGVKEEAISLKSALSCWADKDARPTVTTSIAISCHTGDASAGVFAEATVSANAMGLVSAGASAEASVNVTGKYKKSTVRYQTTYPVRDEGVYIVMTQSSAIVYKQILFDAGIELGVTTKSVVGNKKLQEKMKPLNDKLEEINDKLKYEKTCYNRMTYTATTVYWPCRTTFEAPASKKKAIYPMTSEAATGTGVSFGGSFMIKNLMKFYIGYDFDSGTFESKDIEKYFKNVAESINVTLADLTKFFLAEGIFRLLDELRSTSQDLQNPKAKVEAILLEASFRVTLPEINVNHIVEGVQELFEIDPKTSDKLLKVPAQNRILEAIRVRYRIQDTYNNDSDGFGLGFKFGGVVGLGIKLKKVDRAGSEGIVDLATIWMDPSLGDGTNAYEKAVPPVALFCQ